jgi:hypothetical protein
LVIDPEHGVPIRVAWCLSKREKVEDVICDLRCREGTTAKNIGHRTIGMQVGVAGKEDPIVNWARGKNLHAVVWTARKSNFEKMVGERFYVAAVVDYAKTLTPAGRVKAAEYIWRAPEFVRTPVRDALQAKPWFPSKGRVVGTL